jgi:putative zinc finger protein
MRCQRAQSLMTASLDGELDPRRQRALDRHLAGCEACRSELAATDRVLTALEALPLEAPVPAQLEQATLRRVRLAAAEEAESTASPPWRRWLPLPAVALATAAVAILAVVNVRRTSEVSKPVTTARPAARELAQAPRPTPRGDHQPHRVAKTEPPPNPPAKLAEAPDLFMDMPILRNMDKLRHFEAIQTTTLDDEPATPDGQPPPSNG